MTNLLEKRFDSESDTVDEGDSYFAADPDLIHGGIKYAMNEQKIRIDYVGHGLSIPANT